MRIDKGQAALPTRSASLRDDEPQQSTRRNCTFMRREGERMRSRFIVVPLFAAVCGGSLAALAPYAPNMDRGQELYEAHCQQCHTPNIHSRAGTLPLSRDELSGIVDEFRRRENLGWTPDEI
ncbi:MAG: c-type cytochrome, partial [Burkholderiales bacterium]